jgi:ATP synthase protein I
MTEGNSPRPPNEFGDRIRALKQRAGFDRERAESPADAPRSAMGLAWRVSVELTVGLVVGGGLGWLLDWWWGTSPFLLIVFFFLGAAAGIRNVFRVAQAMMRDAGEEQAPADKPGKEDRSLGGRS